MGILDKLLGSKSKRSGVNFKTYDRLFGAGKLDEAKVELAELWDGKPEDISKEDLDQLCSRRLNLVNTLLGSEQPADVLDYARQVAEDCPDTLIEIAGELVDKEIVDTRSLQLVKQAVAQEPRQKKLLLSLAKTVYAKNRDNLTSELLDFLSETAKAYPLWKDGLGVLADHYLAEERRDAEALIIYRNAYPNRKADRRLREVLLQSLIVNRECDEFAAAVYKDTVETSPDNVQALELLANHYIQNKEITPATLPYIERALEKTKFSQDVLKQLAEQILVSSAEFVDRTSLSEAIYRQGYWDRNLLAYLGEALSEANKFDDLSIEIMTRAFELKVVSKRAVLILTEHCLANDREDEFALSVYETYLGTWPDRPQRRIYSILGHHYAGLTRCDDQAQKIYQEALIDSPTDPVVLTMLARAFHAANRRDESAEEIYRHAFPIADGEVKKQLGTVLAEMRVESGNFSEDTLQYLTIMGRPNRGQLVDTYGEALTNCFLATGRRGEQAQQAYFMLFEKTEDSPELSRRLVELLAEIIKERGVVPDSNSIEMRVYNKLFELEKFGTDAEISFVLLADKLSGAENQTNLGNISVRCFEVDSERFTAVLKQYNAEELLQQVGDFFIEHYNFPQAANAYQAAFELFPTDDIRYRLAKIHLMDGHGKQALDLLSKLKSPELRTHRQYWEAVAHQQLGKVDKSSKQLAEIEDNSIVPEYLIELRQAINEELRGNLESSLDHYSALTGNTKYPQFERWIQLERGIVMMKLRRLEDARLHLEQVHRLNPSWRAEQLFFSLALFLQAHEDLRNGALDEALPSFTRAVEVNRNHRLLRQVIVEILSIYGEKAFFENQLPLAVKIFEVSHRILSKRVETKTYLAYAYHRLEEYARAIIYYRDIGWSDENARFQRSQAYAYIANQQPHKAWRVFLDLARRGNLLKENFPRLVACFLADAEAKDGKYWERITFPKDCDNILYVALLMHDGQFEKAVNVIDELMKSNPKDLRLRWYQGKAYSNLDQKEMAVFNWKELLKACGEVAKSPATQIRQYSEIGLAFLEAGYAEEAMQTWEELRKLDERNTDLPLLFAETLNLNAYQLARKGQNKLACEEWKKAVKFDPKNPSIQQNYSISLLQFDDLNETTAEFRKLSDMWHEMVKAKPQQFGHLAKLASHLEHAMNTIALAKGRPEHDVTRARAEDSLEIYRRANQFYWILSLDKRATTSQIEAEYFRLIKIFNPERHADDFMLVEESYTNLFQSQDRRALIDTFVYNPINTEILRRRLTRMPGDGSISFEKLDLPTTLPPADYQQLAVTSANEDELAQPLVDLLAINYKIPDWTIL